MMTLKLVLSLRFRVDAERTKQILNKEEFKDILDSSEKLLFGFISVAIQWFAENEKQRAAGEDIKHLVLF